MRDIDFSSGCSGREACRRAAQILCEAGIEEYVLDARLLLCEAAGWNTTQYLLHCDDPITDTCALRYGEMIRLRADRVPMQHITGFQEFYGLKIYTTPDALIPRADTEVLVEEALNFLENGAACCQTPQIGRQDGMISRDRQSECPQSEQIRVLDLCTGTGCIAIALARNFPQAVYTAADLSEAALALAARNAAEHGADIRFAQGDLFDALGQSETVETFDLIVSNPPYIRDQEIETLAPEVREHDPYMALSGGRDGLAIYRRLIPQAFMHLKSGGMLWLEIGADQGESVPQLMKEAGFTDIAVKKDLSGRDRAVGGRHV